MTKVNLKTKIIDDHEREGRRFLRARDVRASDGKDSSLYEIQGFPYKFNIKKPAFDAYGSIEAYYHEEDMRQKFFYKFMKPGAVFFDIGACHGSWALPALALGARVVAFEPDPRFCKSISDSVKSNKGFAQRFTLVKKAILEIDYQEISFDELEQVPVTSIDNYVKASGVVPDYIKIDTEGGEGRVIRGMSQTLKHKPRIFVENHLKQAIGAEAWILCKLKDLGYKFIPWDQRTDYVSWSFFDI